MKNQSTQQTAMIPFWKKCVARIKTILISTSIILYSDYSYASAKNIGTIATTITESFAGVAKLITAGAYIAGVGFALTSILKFKAHKDNPTQIPIGTPIALLFVAAALMFLPTLFGIAGQTVFGTTAGMGGLTGTTGTGA